MDLTQVALAKRRRAFAAALRREARAWDAGRPLASFYSRVQHAAAVAPWLSIEAVREAMLMNWAQARAEAAEALRRFDAHDRPILFRATAPWAVAMERFIGKAMIPADKMEGILARLDAMAEAGLLPDLTAAREAAYQPVFTLVREAEARILTHVDALVQRALDGKIGPGDFVQDLNDIYRSMGIAEQDAWYAELVLDNAMNRSWQEGRDSLSHTWNDKTGQWEADSWVWGYEWEHQDSSAPRPTHAAMDGHVAPKDAEVWKTFGPPPIAHHCHCLRHTISIPEAQERGLVSPDGRAARDFAPPNVTADQLRMAGITDSRQVKALSGRPVTEVIGELSGDRFPRSQFNRPNRPLLNPSMALTPAGRRRLDKNETAQEILDGLARAKGWVG
jgi:hypothetical protein